MMHGCLFDISLLLLLYYYTVFAAIVFSPYTFASFQSDYLYLPTAATITTLAGGGAVGITVRASQAG